MFCSNCGSECDDNAVVCVKCGCSLKSKKQASEKPCPPDYLVWSILTTLLCCLPGGIVAIIYSTGVRSEWQAGNYEEALKKSNSAKTWIIVSVVGWVVCIVLYLLLVVGAAAGSY